MKIWFVILLCLLCACGTSRKSTDMERHATSSVILSDSVFMRDSLSGLERILSNERLNAHILIVEWSDPDSIGNQYPVRTTDIDLNKEKDERVDKTTHAGLEATRLKSEDISSTDDERIKENIERDTRPISSRAWWFLVIGGIIAAIIAWLAKRKG